ncbi:MAG TPA: heme exporter protein CcmD [Rhodocyclaceae bacterium]|jgi:heme exporter protein D|nr:heme exporter protein CcmD [Rhodocyclaceae bacterium]
MELTNLSVQWDSLGDFLAMGGYAPFVWTSIGACALTMALEILVLRWRRLRAERMLDEGELA